MTKEYDITKPDVYWCEDSSRVSSLHINDGRLNFQQSLIGRVIWVDGDTDVQCKVTLRDGTELGRYPSVYRARTALEDNYRGIHKGGSK